MGHDVALSGDAQIMAVSAHYQSGGGQYVRLYSKNGADWNMFQQLVNPDEDGWNWVGRLGHSVDLSHDGSILAVSARRYAVFIYELSSIASVYHIHLLDTIYCDDVYEVSVSGNGRVLGIMSSKSSPSYAWVLIRVGNGFQQRGSTFTGYGSYFSGIALNYDATIVAIGDDNYDYDGSHDPYDMGRVSVFQWTDVYGNGFKNCIQMGSDITGDAANCRFGRYVCVSITYDGLTVAVGAEGYDNSKGLVRVYD